MTRPLTSTKILLLTALAISASLFLVACGSDEPDAGAPPAEAPAASDFPKPDGSLDDLLADVNTTDELYASPSGAVFTVDANRFGFGLFEVNGEQIDDAEVAIYAAHGAMGEARGPFPARVESLETEPAFTAQSTADDPDAAKVVYVADVPFDARGEWRLAAVLKEADGLVATRLPSIQVKQYRGIPDEGEPAPRIHTPTTGDVGDLAEIDTRIPHDTMHDDDLANVLGEKPVVLLFATPALCLSRVCGPVVDVAEQVKSESGNEASFIHMEIYEDNVPGDDNLRPQVKTYGLPTEPWLFVIDKQGTVATRIEGAFSVHELEMALKHAGVGES